MSLDPSRHTAVKLTRPDYEKQAEEGRSEESMICLQMVGVVLSVGTGLGGYEEYV